MPSLPPGVNRKDFQDAIAQFQAAVGKEWVFTSDEDVDLYRDSYSPFWNEPEDPVPSAAVAPDGVEQVQQIVRIANKYKIPLWTVSTGKNLAYGGSAPRLSGSVVLDLKRMNRILEVNDRNHYALVEPGVSYFDLYRYTQEKGLNVFIDAPDPGWGSPVGNTLDRGGGHTPLRDHFSTLCGMEVVLANGRRGADRNGRASQLAHLAAVQVWLRAIRGWDFHAVQLRNRHQNGRVALPHAGDALHRHRQRAQT